MANQYLKTGELDIGAFVTGFIVTSVTHPVVSYLLAPVFSGSVFNIAINTANKGVSVFIEN